MAKWAVEYGVTEMFNPNEVKRHAILICDNAQERDKLINQCRHFKYPVYGYRTLTKEEERTRTLKTPVVE